MKTNFQGGLANGRLLATATLALALLWTHPASAVPLGTEFNWDIFGPVGALDSTATDAFIGAGNLGSLTTNVYFDGSLYTYENIVTPATNNISEFVTAFGVDGFNGVAGWSFSEAAAAGGAGDASDFLIDNDLLDNTLDWETTGAGFSAPGTNGFGSGETITFFFQSDLPPAPNFYALINGGAGNARTLGPAVPEPSTVLLLGSALFGLGFLRRRKDD